jgi:hypothetical protein
LSIFFGSNNKYTAKLNENVVIIIPEWSGRQQQKNHTPVSDAEPHTVASFGLCDVCVRDT